MSINSEADDLTNKIVKVFNERKPESLKELTDMLKKNLGLGEKENFHQILKHQANSIIEFKNLNMQSYSFTNYLKTRNSVWFWIMIVTAMLTAMIVFSIPENLYPWIYVRNIMGIIFVLFLPGYALTKALLLFNRAPKTPADQNLQAIEQFALSIGLSIALVSIVGLILYYLHLSPDLYIVVFSLLAFTSVVVTITCAKEYQMKKAN